MEKVLTLQESEKFMSTGGYGPEKIVVKPEHIYLPSVIYKNLELLLKYRKLNLVSGSIPLDSKKPSKPLNSFLGDIDFIKTIQFDGYVLIEASDQPDKIRKYSKDISEKNKLYDTKTYILLIDMDDRYTQKSQDIGKLLSKIQGFTDVEYSHNIDMLIITKEKLSLYIMKKIDKIITNGDDMHGFIRIFTYQYMHFTSERPLHKLTAPHRILSPEEEVKVLEELNTEKRNIRKIHHNDAIAIWHGAEIGNIMEVLLSSEVCGTELIYLVVRA